MLELYSKVNRKLILFNLFVKKFVSGITGLICLAYNFFKKEQFIRLNKQKQKR